VKVLVRLGDWAIGAALIGIGLLIAMSNTSLWSVAAALPFFAMASACYWRKWDGGEKDPLMSEVVVM
jgi:hypothetical protein